MSNLTGCDTRPRLHVTRNRDGATVTFARHPAAKGYWAASIEDAITSVLVETGATDVVVFFGPNAMAPP